MPLLNCVKPDGSLVGELQVSYSEATAAFEVLGKNLEEALEGYQPSSPQTYDVLCYLDNEQGCERIANFLRTFRDSPDCGACCWVCLGFDS